jgi:hypothetical protein
MKTSTPSVRLDPHLQWSHQGAAYRVSPWPELIFQYRQGARWMRFIPDPSQAEFASIERMIDEAQWAAFVGFMPPAEREFVQLFRHGRLAAVALIAQCPTMVQDLREVPALAPFVAHHVALRGVERPCWGELAAVHERAGLFGLLEWLGLPASREVLAILQRVARPDLACSLLEPIRRVLWEPATAWFLRQADSISDQQLRSHCRLRAAA